MANFLVILVEASIASFTPWPKIGPKRFTPWPEVGPTHVNPRPEVGQSSTQWPEGSPTINLLQATQAPQYPPGTWPTFNLPPGLEQVSPPFGIPNSNLDSSNSAPISYAQSDVTAKPESFFDSSVVDTNFLEEVMVDFVRQRQGGGYSFNTMCSLLAEADFDHTQIKHVSTDLTPGECPICCENEGNHLFRPDTCPSGPASSSSSVNACGKCWSHHLSISDTCMCKKCDPISLLPLIEKFGNLKLKARRRRHRIEKFGRFYGYTPCGNCNDWVVKSFGNFICNCGNDFCTRCENKIHHPWTCEEARELNFSADASEKVIEKTTKACPRCDSRIEKNKGCNHMTCWKCGCEFCWICLKKWGDFGCGIITCSSGQNDSDLIRSKKQWDEWESKMEGILNRVKKDFAKRNRESNYDLIRAARLVIASIHFMRINGDAEEIIHKECGKLVDGMVALTKTPSKREKRDLNKDWRSPSVDLGALVRNLENALGK